MIYALRLHSPCKMHFMPDKLKMLKTLSQSLSEKYCDFMWLQGNFYLWLGFPDSEHLKGDLVINAMSTPDNQTVAN